jgi:hypothetical protein
LDRGIPFHIATVAVLDSKTQRVFDMGAGARADHRFHGRNDLISVSDRVSPMLVRVTTATAVQTAAGIVIFIFLEIGPLTHVFFEGNVRDVWVKPPSTACLPCGLSLGHWSVRQSYSFRTSRKIERCVFVHMPISTLCQLSFFLENVPVLLVKEGYSSVCMVFIYRTCGWKHLPAESLPCSRSLMDQVT